MKILIIGNRGNLQKFLKLKEINLSTETNLTNLYVHYENDKYYICVTVNPYSVIELKLGLNISQKIILLLDREKDDENELITLLRKVKEDLKDKIIITCALGEDLKGIDSTYKKIQSILEDTILLDTVNLLDNEILNDLYLDDKDSNNESFDTKEIILNQLTHAGLGKGYEVLKLDNEVERMELLTQKSIYIGCLHSNNSYFISKDDNNLDSEIPVLISRNNERLNLIMVNPQNTESTNEDDILTFNLYSNDWLKIINLRLLISNLAKINSIDLKNIRYLELEVRKDNKKVNVPNLYNLSIDIDKEDNWSNINNHCRILLKDFKLNTIPIQAIAKVVKIFKNMIVNKQNCNILGCRLINGSFKENDIILIDKNYYKIQQIWQNQNRSKEALILNQEYGLLLDSNTFSTKVGDEVTFHNEINERIIFDKR